MPAGTLIVWSLSGTYDVHGTVTGFEYETLPGVSVVITNLATGESATVTADDAGEYGIDLGDASLYPSGYASGDEIKISVTHRDTTRTWKRRVSGTEVSQDLYMTHGTWQGAASRSKILLTSDTYPNRTGTSVLLRDALTRDVVQVRLNDEALDMNAWSFSRPATLTLTSGLSASDVLEVDRVVYRSISQIKTDVVAEGDAQVRDAMAKYYPSPLPERVPQLQELSESLAAARIMDIVGAGPDKINSEAQSLRKYARERLNELRAGKVNLTDQDGAYLTPTAKTTTPQAAPAPTRAYTNRFQDRVGARKDV